MLETPLWLSRSSSHLHGCVIMSFGTSGASRGSALPPTTVNMGQVLPPSCHCWSEGKEWADGVCNPGSLQDRSKSTKFGSPAESMLQEDGGEGGKQSTCRSGCEMLCQLQG